MWTGLLLSKLVTEPEGSAEYIYWEHELRDMTDEQLLTGLENAKNHKGWLTIGGFRGLCEKPETAPCHKPFEALPKPKVDLIKRRELAAKMREATGFAGPAPKLKDCGI